MPRSSVYLTAVAYQDAGVPWAGHTKMPLQIINHLLGMQNYGFHTRATDMDFFASAVGGGLRQACRLKKPHVEILDRRGYTWSVA